MFSGYEKDIAEMDVLTRYKIRRVRLAKIFGISPAALDSAGDAPDFDGLVDIRRHELQDMQSVIDGAIMAYNQHGVKVFL